MKKNYLFLLKMCYNIYEIQCKTYIFINFLGEYYGRTAYKHRPNGRYAGSVW